MRILRHSVSDEGGVHRLLGGVHPGQHPSQITHRQGVVVFGAKGARIIQGAVADHSHDREPQAGSHGQGLEGIEPAHAARADKDPCPYGRGVLNNLKLGMLALRHDILRIEVAVGDHFGYHLHDRIVGTDRIGRHHIDIDQAAGLGNSLTAADQHLLVIGLWNRPGLFRSLCRSHLSFHFYPPGL